MIFDISCIIPIYNSYKTLLRCVLSVYTQKANKTIILIDDGAYDQSGKECDKLSMVADSILVLHKFNEGVAYARRDGFELANSEWLTCLDADDMLPSSAYRILQTIANKTNVDIVKGCSLMCSEDSIQKTLEWIEYANLKKMYIEEFQIQKNKNDIQKSFFRSKQGFLVLYMFNKRIYKDIVTLDLRYGEDTLIAYQLCENASTMATCESTTYLNIVNNQSATKQKYTRRRFDNFVAMDFIVDRLAYCTSYAIKKSIYYYYLNMIIFNIRDAIALDGQVYVRELWMKYRLVFLKYMSLRSKVFSIDTLRFTSFLLFPKLYITILSQRMSMATDRNSKHA